VVKLIELLVNELIRARFGLAWIYKSGNCVSRKF